MNKQAGKTTTNNENSGLKIHALPKRICERLGTVGRITIEYPQKGRQGTRIMMGRLVGIENWPELARKAQFRAVFLARICRISLRQLERFFQTKTGQPPQQWLDQLRLKTALILINRGIAVKLVAFELGYKQSSHFSREFKRAYGLAPNHYREHVAKTTDVAPGYEMSPTDTRSALNCSQKSVVIHVNGQGRPDAKNMARLGFTRPKESNEAGKFNAKSRLAVHS